MVTITLLFLALFGCAASSTQESTGEYIDDSTITAKVKTAIFNEPTLKSAEINVETFKGSVQLSGFVSSQADINTVLELTQNIKGVQNIENSMMIK